MPSSLDETVAVVSGAASGIGRATCGFLLDQRAIVVGVDRSRLPDELADRPGMHSIIADVSQAGSVAAAAAEVTARFGRCTALVNSAGVLASGTVTQTSEADWDRVMAVNLRGVWLMSRAFLPLMVASGGGSIVHLASASGLRPLPDLAAYSASKAAVISLSRSIALEYADAGIRSNCVCPGPTLTPMLLNDEANIAALEAGGGQWPVPLAEPAEIARAIMLLLAPDMPSLSGAALAVDRGRALY
jgi:NAD(P)-dependent dehydrogenase (short-subunit alcohol dehydrogenase family)